MLPRSLLIAGLLLPTLASAAPGPWTLGGNDTKVELGASYARWRTFRTGGPQGAAFPQTESVTRNDFIADIRYGVLDNVEVRVRTSWASQAMSVNDSRCREERLGAEGCATTRGVSPVNTRLKIRLLDQLNARPITLTVGPDLRFGDHTRDTAHRMTNIGLGQSDYGAFASLGREGSLGSGYVAMFFETSFYRRLALTELDNNGMINPSAPNQTKIPGDEVQGRFELIYYPSSPVAFGVIAQGRHMLTGYNWSQLETNVEENPNLFVSLKSSQVDVGLQAVVRSIENVEFHAWATYPVFARNEPMDELIFGATVARFFPSGVNR